MCLSEASSRAIQLDGPAGVAPALDGRDGLRRPAARTGSSPRHDRAPSCRVRVVGGHRADRRGPDPQPGRGRSATSGSVAAASAAFTDRDRRFLVTLSDLASIAITSARMRESERQGAIVAERERIAREMHDSLAQILGVTHLRLRGARRAPGGRRGAPASLTELADLADRSPRRRTATSARRSWACAKPSRVGPRASSRASRAYLEKYSHQAGIPATLETALDGELIAPAALRGPAHPGHPGGADQRPEARRRASAVAVRIGERRRRHDDRRRGRRPRLRRRGDAARARRASACTRCASGWSSSAVP